MDKEKAKLEVEKIVKKFLSVPKKELDDMPEEQIKFRFIEPLFVALGWEREDISKETRILKGRADYILKIGNQDRLVVEAKKTDVKLLEEEGRQAVSYAYHKNIKFSVLTNFKQIRVYHALSNIKDIDRNLLKDDKGYLWIDCENFIEQFDRLWLLSKESLEKEEINKLLKNIDKKLIKPINETILTDLLQIREWLSKDLKNKRNYLQDSQIDEIVQILIDRLIFMRSVEDRGLEEKDFLLKKVNDVQQSRTDSNLWALLKTQFRIFDQEYNSKLFSEGLLEKEGVFDDKELIKVIKGLYYGTQDHQERYMFDEIPVDLLGSIYEQYLGVVLRGTEKRVKLDLLSGKRKSMGIYYTPSYIVDYIVKNTIGEYIKDKSIDEILDVRILDPACGSGSFLIKAFQEVCNSIESMLKKGEKSNKYKHTFQKWEEKLSLGEKATILVNCIFGVDLDEKAVELAQLNLLLKVLEEETKETKKRILPAMKDNVKNGNSLIDDSKISDKAFNWQAQFPNVFRQGGFDVVIGNPPYIRIQTLDKTDIDYFSKKYISAVGNYDIYSLFIEKGVDLIKEFGKIGFILPNKFFISNYGEPLRDFIIKNRVLKEIVNFKDNQIFEGVSTYTCLLFLEKYKNKNIKYSEMNKIDKIKEYLEKIPLTSSFDNGDLKIGIVQEDSIKNGVWNFNVGINKKIIQKLSLINSNLKSQVDKIFVGLQTSADSIYLVKLVKDLGENVKIKSEETGKEYIIEKEFTKKLVKGKDINQYYINYSDRILIFPYIKKEKGYEVLNEEELKKYKGIYSYFKELESKIKDREHKKLAKSKSWFALTYPRSINLYDSPKILTPNSAFHSSFYFDEKEHYYMTCGVAGGFALILKKDCSLDPKYLVGILNSKLMEFFNRNIGTSLQGGYYSYDPKIIERYPLILSDRDQQQKIISLVNQMLELQKKYHDIKVSGNEKERLEQQIKNVDYEIDEEIYNLYGITEEEKKIIEESLK